jgi:hypothetical protein
MTPESVNKGTAPTSTTNSAMLRKSFMPSLQKILAA